MIDIETGGSTMAYPQKSEQEDTKSLDWYIADFDIKIE